MIDNRDKVAVIFGVRNEQSLAYAIAHKLSQSGCKVAMSYTPETKDEVLYLMRGLGQPEDCTAEVDVRNEGQIQVFLQKIHAMLGSIHYLLHGVAFGSQAVLCNKLPGTEKPAPSYINIPFDDLADSFNVSAYSLLRIARAVEPFLAQKASILSLTYQASQKVIPGYAGMAVNKAALENISLYLADYFRTKQVRVNALSPGFVMTTSSGSISGVRKLRKITKDAAPLGNVNPDDVANAALYYFSGLSEKVTGNIHYVDGGFHIMGVTGDE